jgi:hypothetical protein
VSFFTFGSRFTVAPAPEGASLAFLARAPSHGERIAATGAPVLEIWNLSVRPDRRGAARDSFAWRCARLVSVALRAIGQRGASRHWPGVLPVNAFNSAVKWAWSE